MYAYVPDNQTGVSITCSLTRVNPPISGAVGITGADYRYVGIDGSSCMWDDSGTDDQLTLLLKYMDLAPVF